MDDKPCCCAEALGRVKQIEVNGRTIGILWLEPTIKEIAALNLQNDDEIASALMARIKACNYIPRGLEVAYARAILKEYHAYKNQNP